MTGEPLNIRKKICMLCRWNNDAASGSGQYEDECISVKKVKKSTLFVEIFVQTTKSVKRFHS